MQKNIDLTIRELLTASQNESHLTDIGTFLSWYDAHEFHEEMWLILIAAVGSRYFEGDIDATTRENLLFTFGTLLKFTAAVATLLQDGTDELYTAHMTRKRLLPSSHCAN